MRRGTAALVLTLTALAGSTSAGAPPTISLPGWVPAGPVETFGPDTLWDAINGGAELFLSYGFVELQMVTLKQGELEVSIQLYDQGTPLNAFGVFQRQRPATGQTIDAGTAALSAPPYQCLLYKGSTYAKLAPLKGQLDALNCGQLLTALAEIIPGTAARPPELAVLPGKDREPGTLGYTRKGYLGLADLTECVHADYRSARLEGHTIFVMLPPAGKSAAEVWATLAKSWTAPPGAKIPALSREVPYKGPVVLTPTKGGIIGVVGPKLVTQALEILTRVR